MFSNIGGPELLIVAVVALIVVGPKELPGLFRNAGRFVGRLRGMADDFRYSMEAAADDAGVNEIKKDFDELGKDARELDREMAEEARNVNDEGIEAPAKSVKKSKKSPKDNTDTGKE